MSILLGQKTKRGARITGIGDTKKMADDNHRFIQVKGFGNEGLGDLVDQDHQACD